MTDYSKLRPDEINVRTYVQMYNAIYNRMREVCSEEEMVVVGIILDKGLLHSLYYMNPLVSPEEMQRLILEVSL